MSLKFNISILGLSQIVKSLSGVKSKMAETLSDGMREAAFIVEGNAKRQITSGSNRAIATGYLRASIGVTSVLPYRATVTAQANYGVFVHDGTRFMRARPFLAAGLKDSVDAIEKMFGKRVEYLVTNL